jgi:hypothetical protein
MKYIIMTVLATLTNLFLPSCSKKDVKPSSSQEEQPGPAKPRDKKAFMLRGGGEDEETPIVMHKVKNQANAPVSQARVIMVNETQTDTLEAETDSLGEAEITLPVTGPWLTVVSRPGYHPVYSVNYFVDSFTIKTSMLRQP